MDSLKILAGLFAVGGIVLLGIGGYVLYTQFTAIQGAEPVNATVESATMAGEDGSRFAPVVVYRYQYEGQTYRNDNLFPGVPTHQTTGDRAFTLSHEYEAGDRITVYVDEDDPSQSFVFKEFAFRPLLGFIGGGVFIGGLSVIMFVWDSRRDEIKGWLDKHFEGVH